MFSHNDDGTINEYGEGTLTKCECGREFFLSFEKGFVCEVCQRKNFKTLAASVRELLKDENLQAFFRKYDNGDKGNK